MSHQNSLHSQAPEPQCLLEAPLAYPQMLKSNKPTFISGDEKPEPFKPFCSNSSIQQYTSAQCQKQELNHSCSGTTSNNGGVVKLTPLVQQSQCEHFGQPSSENLTNNHNNSNVNVGFTKPQKPMNTGTSSKHGQQISDSALSYNPVNSSEQVQQQSSQILTSNVQVQNVSAASCKQVQEFSQNLESPNSDLLYTQQNNINNNPMHFNLVDHQIDENNYNPNPNPNPPQEPHLQEEQPPMPDAYSEQQHDQQELYAQEEQNYYNQQQQQMMINSDLQQQHQAQAQEQLQGFSVFNRLYDRAKVKKQSQDQTSTFKQYQPGDDLNENIKANRCEMLYQESQHRLKRQHNNNLMEDQKCRIMSQGGATGRVLSAKEEQKTRKLASEKVRRDIEQVLQYVDCGEELGAMTIKQVGQVFVILGVFEQLLAENKNVNPDRQKREEEFLCLFWGLMTNPDSNGDENTNQIKSSAEKNQTKVEVSVLYTLLKTLYEPYFDGSVEHFKEIALEVAAILSEIQKWHNQTKKQIFSESFMLLETPPKKVNSTDKVPDSKSDQIESRYLKKQKVEDENDQIAKDQSMYQKANELLKELLTLSNCFQAYKSGLVKVPSIKFKQSLAQEMAECTFHPRVDLQSTLMDKKLKQKRSVTKVNDQIIASNVEKEAAMAKRVAQMQQKESERLKKISRERALVKEKETEGCTFKPTLIARNKSTSNNNAAKAVPSIQIHSVDDRSRQSVCSQMQNTFQSEMPKDSEQKTSKEIREEQEYSKCTFKPDTSKTLSKKSVSKKPSSAAVPNGFDKKIQQMKKGQEMRKEQEKVFNELGALKTQYPNYKANSSLRLQNNLTTIKPKPFKFPTESVKDKRLQSQFFNPRQTPTYQYSSFFTSPKNRQNYSQSQFYQLHPSQMPVKILDVQITVPDFSAPVPTNSTDPQPQKEARIRIYQGDSVRNEVREFGTVWQLNSETQDAVFNTICEHLERNKMIQCVQEGFTYTNTQLNQGEQKILTTTSEVADEKIGTGMTDEKNTSGDKSETMLNNLEDKDVSEQNKQMQQQLQDLGLGDTSEIGNQQQQLQYQELIQTQSKLEDEIGEAKVDEGLLESTHSLKQPNGGVFQVDEANKASYRSHQIEQKASITSQDDEIPFAAASGSGQKLLNQQTADFTNDLQNLKKDSSLAEITNIQSLHSEMTTVEPLRSSNHTTTTIKRLDSNNTSSNTPQLQKERESITLSTTLVQKLTQIQNKQQQDQQYSSDQDCSMQKDVSITMQEQKPQVIANMIAPQGQAEQSSLKILTTTDQHVLLNLAEDLYNSAADHEGPDEELLEQTQTNEQVQVKNLPQKDEKAESKAYYLNLSGEQSNKSAGKEDDLEIIKIKSSCPSLKSSKNGNNEADDQEEEGGSDEENPFVFNQITTVSPSTTMSRYNPGASGTVQIVDAVEISESAQEIAIIEIAENGEEENQNDQTSAEEAGGDPIRCDISGFSSEADPDEESRDIQDILTSSLKAGEAIISMLERNNK